EPHIQYIAFLARDLIDGSRSAKLTWGAWHLPLFGFEGDEVQGTRRFAAGLKPRTKDATTALGAFMRTWDALNGKRNFGEHAWENCPWVWVVEFQKIKPEEVTNG